MAIDASEAIGWGLARAGTVAFRPFSFRKWLAMGAVAWLAGISEYGAFGILIEWLGAKAWHFFSDFENAMNTVSQHMVQVTAWMLAAVVLLFGIYILFRWVNCRGTFMMFDSVVNNEPQGWESWRRHRTLGNSLLKFRIMWDLAIFNVFLFVFVAAGILAWQDVSPMMRGDPYAMTTWTRAGGIVLVAGMILAALAVSVANLFLHHFVVTVMYVRNMPAKEAFRHSRREMLRQNKKATAMFLLILMVASSVHRVATLVGTILSVVGLLLTVVPVLAVAAAYPGAVSSLPVEVFMRAYSLRFIAQFGKEYQPSWPEEAMPGTTPPQHRQLRQAPAAINPK